MQLWDPSPKRFRTIRRPLFLPPLADAPNYATNHSLQRQRTIRPRSFSANTGSSSSSNSHGCEKPRHEYVQKLYPPPLTPPRSISSEVTRSMCDPNVCPAGSQTSKTLEGTRSTCNRPGGSQTSKSYTLNRLLDDIRHGIVDRPVEIDLGGEDKPRLGGGISGGFTSNQWAVVSWWQSLAHRAST
jgi:hypothetical protein